MSKLILACDLGSSGCKTVVVAVDEGQVVASVRSDYATSRLHPGWAEQDPDDWYDALLTSVRQVVASPRVDVAAIAGVVIVGVTHTAVLVGSDGRPLAPSILMFDSRSVPQAHSIATQWGDEVRRRTLNVPTPVWTWPQFEWIRVNRPDLWRNTSSVKFQKDYVRDRLVSESDSQHHVTDHIDAAGSLLFDPIESSWVTEFCDEVGLDVAKLPAIVDPAAVVGGLSREAAEDLGLVAGTPVLAGTTDTVAEMVGSGAVRVGQGVLKLASVGRVAVVADAPILEDNILNYRHIVDDLWYPSTASKFAASAYRWLRESLWVDADDADCYKVMDAAAGTVPAGSDGVLFHPHLSGQWAPYWDPDLRASFLGLTVRHGREHFTRAVLEGVAFSILDVLEDLERYGGGPSEFRLIGQGAVSSVWAQIMADVIGRPLSVPAQVDAAFGAALIGGLGVGLLDNSATAIENVIGDSAVHYSPDGVNSRMYRELFDIYKETVVHQQDLGKKLQAFDSRDWGESL